MDIEQSGNQHKKSELENMKTRKKDKLDMLFISQELPYRNVPHAGGKTLYYYLSRLVNDMNITLLSFCNPGEEGKGDELLELGIKRVHVIPVNNDVAGFTRLKRRLSRVLRFLLSPEQAVFHAGTEAVLMNRVLRDVHKCSSRFDLVQLEWTSSLAFLRETRRLYPDASIISSLHDFSVAALDRKLKMVYKPRQRFLYKKQQLFEIEHIRQCDLILAHGPADLPRLAKVGIKTDKIQWLCPYYTDLEGCALQKDRVKTEESLNLLFFGAMWREENWHSVIEFIVKVLYPLRANGIDIRLTVLGANPPAQLLSYQNANIVTVQGFVENVRPFFANSDIFISPLLMGGGIKVKVLEAMSAGLPVIGNEVAMEGIGGNPGVEYFQADSWQEWHKVLSNLYYEQDILPSIGIAGMVFLKNNFNPEKSYSMLLNTYDYLIS
jgi:glycosyltransferase involved in cell wall biosynthesis